MAAGHTVRTMAFRIPELQYISLKKKKNCAEITNDKGNVGEYDYNKFDIKMSVVHHKERKRLATEWEKIYATYIAIKNLYLKYIKNFTSQ